MNRKILYTILALALTLLSAGFGFRPAYQTTNTDSVHLRQYDLLTATTGWVLLDHQLFWTSDKGQTWNEIGPSVPVDAVIQDVKFIDSAMGWMLWMTINADGTSSFFLTHTNDHGSHWNITPLALFDANDAAAYAERAHMGWFGEQTGWITIKQSSGSNFSIGSLFTTSDGGHSWTRSALPVADRVTFTSPQIGWASGAPTGNQLFETQDGGATWQSSQLDLPSGSSSTIYEPISAAGRTSVVTTSVDNENLTLRVFHNSSKGWSAAEPLTWAAQPGIIGLSMLDPQSFVAAIPGTDVIVRMHDAATETLKNQDGLSASIVDLDMVSADLGWAKSVHSSCVTLPGPDAETASVSCTSTTRLLQTDNGGVTWKDVPLPSTVLASGSLIENSLTVQSLSNLGNTEVFIGQGFDRCEIPTTAQLQEWSQSSPYKAVNLYIGGSSRACLNTALTASYVKQISEQGWKFIPTWVGPQAPCTGYGSRISSDPTTAYNQGVSEANLAVERLAELGLTYSDKTGSVIYYDIEHYGTDTTCRDLVNAFMNGWVSQLHARGNIAGVYASTLCNTGLSDFRSIANVPDVVWPARWYHALGQGFYDPTASIWDTGSCVPSTVWANHQRILQYEGDHNETWGNLTLDIDSDVLDGVVAIPSLNASQLSFQEIVGGLNNPVWITNANDGSGRLFVLERSGLIRIIKNKTLLATPFLDIQTLVKSTSSEQGLLALAFDPAYKSNGRFFVAYTAPRNNDANGSILTLRRYSVSAGNSDQANAASGVTILTIDHPTNVNHNGGTLLFGNDGYLYWSTGDGGGAGDLANNAQDLTKLLGKILRIDVHSGSPYSIPKSNPFYGSSNSSIRKEIWAYGLRNPWRISFDRDTHDLYIGDVGQSAREEIDFQPSTSTGGQNYGWHVMEGSICYDPPSGCDQTGKILPIAEYDHTLGCAVTGGYVYRGASYLSLSGYYIYGDYCSGRLFSTHKNSPTGWSTPVQLADTAFTISTFGEDEQGELYLADYSTGKIFRIQYTEPAYTIHGNVGYPVIVLKYVVGSAQSVTSDANGDYSIQVPAGWTGTVTPTDACYTFDPPSRSYTNLNVGEVDQDYAATFNPSSNCANIGVTIGTTSVDNVGIQKNKTLARNYTGINKGPLEVSGLNSIPVISSLRVLFSNKSYSEMMGLPVEQLSQEYWFPSYNNVNLNSQLRVGNLGNTSTTISVYLGTTKIDSYTLAAGAATRKNYTNRNGGPLRVTSSATKILSTIRLLYNGTSFSELMGLPKEQLATSYLFPYYNNVAMTSNLQVSNVGDVPTTINVYLGSSTTPIDTFSLAAKTTVSRNYAGKNSGPLKVVSSSANIVPSIRVLFSGQSYSEMIGYPGNQLTNEFWYPVYDNINLNSQLRVSNVGTGPTTITVYAGTTQIANYTLGAGKATRYNYAWNTGPLHVVSSSQPILSTVRELYKTPTFSSFYELMGLPKTQLATQYYFPWYNNVAMNSELRLAVP